MAEMPIRRQTSEDDAEKLLRLCAEDPMWAAHAEVSKVLLARAADELAALRKDAERYRWLRSDATPPGEDCPAVYMMDEFGGVLLGEVLDAAVDAAIAGSAAVGAA